VETEPGDEPRHEEGQDAHDLTEKVDGTEEKQTRRGEGDAVSEPTDDVNAEGDGEPHREAAYDEGSYDEGNWDGDESTAKRFQGSLPGLEVRILRRTASLGNPFGHARIREENP
jgi:hypothetical protein